MEEILRFLKTNEVWIYILLGVVGLWYLRKLLIALAEWRGALFGLEKDNAQRRLSEAMSVLILLALMGAGEFLLVSFISPTFPGISVLPTATLDILATPTVTLPPPGATLPVGTGSPQDVALAPAATATIAPASAATDNQSKSGCVKDQLEFLFPDKPGADLKGVVVLKGTVNVQDFGFYKYEFTTPGSNDWTTIAAGEQVVTAASNPPNQLGTWDTSQLTPGDYLLRLVVTDHEGNKLPDCQIAVHVSPP
jgi:hypothetical protein